MTYETLLVASIPSGINVTINRSAQKNALNFLLLTELHDVLNQAQKDNSIRVIVLTGQQGIFCTGMDFQELSQSPKLDQNSAIKFATSYMTLLKRFTLLPKIIVTKIDGQVMAGGIGLIAASDIAIATSRSQFSLSEALWGLLPANVLPYLIRRIGFQKSYLMTLSTQIINATEALSIHLIDDLNDQLDESLRKYLVRLSRLDETTISDLKQYFRKLWIISEEMEKTAVLELTRLMQEPRIINNIRRYVEQGRFPWEAIND